jgi:hypothetical protein
MVARWDGTYGLPTTEQDWYTTYYGGTGFYTVGDGIDAAIQQGSLVNAILQAGIPASVRAYLLSGDINNIPTIHNEHTGPSDGVVFINSASSTQAIGTVSGNVTVHLNHLELGWGSDAVNQVTAWLAQP